MNEALANLYARTGDDRYLKLAERYSYGYNRAERIEDYKTAQEFVLTLAEAGARESITWRIQDESVRVRSARGSRSRSSVRFRRCCWPGAGHGGRKRRF